MAKTSIEQDVPPKFTPKTSRQLYDSDDDLSSEDETIVRTWMLRYLLFVTSGLFLVCSMSKRMYSCLAI